MPIIVKALDDGQLPSSATSLYTVTNSPETVKISRISFFNTGSTTETIVLYVKKINQTARKIAQFKLAQNEWVLWNDLNEITLNSGDQLQAETTTASTVDYYIAGTVDA